MMAMRCSLVSAPFVITLNNHASNKGPRNSSRFVMCASNHVSVNLQIRSSDHMIKNKVFEDRSAGIVCYKDENGEITCEGYDEGPRFHQQLSTFAYSSRDIEIIDLLQRCWLHVADGYEFDNISADKGIAAATPTTDFNCNNGFNKLF